MAERFKIFRVLAQRDPFLLHVGQSISVVGDGIANVAFALLVLSLTHSPVDLGWFAAARMTPTVLLLLVGGVIVDRFPRRAIILFSDIMRCLLTTGTLALLISHHLLFVDLLVFAFFFGTFDALFMPAVSALIPQIVTAEYLPAMNANRELSNNLFGYGLGPAIGGVVAAYSLTWAVGLDAASFAISTVMMSFLRRQPQPEVERGERFLTQVREGLRFARRTRWFWTSLVVVSVINALLFSPSVIYDTFLLRHTFHSSARILGLTLGAGGVSGGLTALFIGNLPVPRRRVRGMWTAWSLASASTLLVAFAGNYWWVIISNILCVPLLVTGNVIWMTLMQSEVPEELMGRVASIDMFASLGLAPIGYAIAGGAIAAFGVRTYLVATFIIGILPSLYILQSRKINAFDHQAANVTGPTPLVNG